MSNKININHHLIISLFFLAFSQFVAQTTEIVVGKVGPGEIDMAAFQLSEDAHVKISGKGATFGHWDEEMAFYGWILDSRTRQIVWHLREESEFDEDEGLFEFEARINLPAGYYEVYYAGSVRNYVNITGWGDFWNKVFGDTKYKASYRRKLYMNLTSNSPSFRSANAKQLVDDITKSAIVSIIRVGDYEDFQKSFTLSKDTEVRIYSLGEGRQGSNYDFAWIYDETNHERFWIMNTRRADHAGGGKKNILVDDEIMLPAGSYTVRYSTDDSHSFDEWNVLPPDDPQFWGITIWPVDQSDLANVKAFTAADRIDPIVEIIRVKDDEFNSQGFSLLQDMELRVYCLGEGSGSLMADYGWIIDAETKKTVWKMNKRRTEHAGGADKNRLVDEVIKLDKGDYIVYYTTDDSHNYMDWNSTRPIDGERWGITIWPADKNDADNVQLFDEDEYKKENVLAEIARVRDGKNIHKKFTVDDNMRLRIMAIGEGDRNDMYDYGWIENEKGRVIWEMTYRKTEHAGGAKKNRMFNDSILLEKGSYYVYYKSDGSHSYNDWNATAPDNPEMYGITILLDK